MLSSVTFVRLVLSNAYDENLDPYALPEDHELVIDVNADVGDEDQEEGQHVNDNLQGIEVGIIDQPEQEDGIIDQPEQVVKHIIHMRRREFRVDRIYETEINIPVHLIPMEQTVFLMDAFQNNHQ